MKNICLSIFLLVSICSYAQNYTITTFNIRYDNGHDGDDNWEFRRKGVADILLKNNNDIIGLQEVLHNQLQYLDSALTGYSHVGVGRDNGKTKGEYSPIYYKVNKFTLLKKGWFWLSETPDKPSMGWDAACKRICTWVMLRDTVTKKEFYVYNTHFDHKGTNAKKQSATMLVTKIEAAKNAGYPVLFMGDLNSRPESEPISTLQANGLVNDAKAITKAKAEGTAGTANSFKLDGEYTTRIDYVFVTPGITVNNYTVINDKLPNGRWPSDHFPVLIKISF